MGHDKYMREKAKKGKMYKGEERAKRGIGMTVVFEEVSTNAGNSRDEGRCKDIEEVGLETKGK